MTQTAFGTSDPTDDVPAHEAELTHLLLRQLTRGVPHPELLRALMVNYLALAKVHTCCTHEAGRAALTIGGILIAASTAPPANTPLH